MQLTLIKPKELIIGQPIPWPLYDAAGEIVLEQGSKPESAQQIQSLIDRGAGRDVESKAEQPDQTDQTDQTEQPDKSESPARAETPRQPQREQGGLSLDQISLKIGDSIQLQLQTGSENTRCFVTLIGYLVDQGVIVSMPVVNGRIMLIREGQSVIVRFFSGKNAYAFSALARKSTSVPFPYLHLSYPNEVRGLVVRGSSRAHAHINGHVSAEDGIAYTCVARDISIGGALIAVQETVAKTGEKLALKLPLQINEVEHMLSLSCVVRSVNTDRPSATGTAANLLGLSFENTTSQDTLVISALLYQNLVSENKFIE